MPVEIIEVAPRDGLQNETKFLPTAAKAELVTRSIAAGLRRVELTSFVNPKRVPQLADAEDLVTAVGRPEGVTFAALILNQRGLDRAAAARVDEVNFVVVASETFSVRNQGTTVSESVDAWRAIADGARAAGLRPTVTVAAAFGCPFEGEVPLRRVAEIVAAVAEAEPVEIALADTIGVAAPRDVRERLAAVADVVGEVRLRCHFHNTRNTGVANALAAVEAGVTALDASTGGIGGCPFAPAATGNVPTEDLVYLLDRMGIETGVLLEPVMATAVWLGEQLGRTVPGLLSRAGVFPATGS